jgi:ech hydrogenase subunit D
MTKALQLTATPLELLTGRVLDLKTRGYRLAQICATRLGDKIELTYSFDLDLELKNLRVDLSAQGARIPSISNLYWCAFIYENEIHDLFDVAVDNLAVDFQGNFYQTAVKYPFGSPKAPSLKPAAVTVEQPAVRVSTSSASTR